MGQITIYAELNKRQYGKLTSGEYTLSVPSGVYIKNKAGSRSIRFYCDTARAAKMMIEALDADGINYSITDGESELDSGKSRPTIWSTNDQELDRDSD